MRYLIQHGAGLGPLVLDALRADLGQADLGDVEILFADDSAVVVDTPAQERRVAGLGYVKNVFRIVADTPRGDVAASVDQLVQAVRDDRLLADGPRGAAFRTMVTVDGQLTGLPRATRTRLETAIAEQTGGRLNARGGTGVEYWVIARRDLTRVVLGQRLTSGPTAKPPRGALAPDIARLLVLAGDPRPDDVFLDPFCGSGALVVARTESPLRRAIAADLDLDGLDPVLRRSRDVVVVAEDAMALPSVADGTVDCVVTDPPWGEYEAMDQDYADFAGGMLRTFDRVLHRGTGRLVLLVARRLAEPVGGLWPAHQLKVERDYDVLVNGHPATVLVGGR